MNKLLIEKKTKDVYDEEGIKKNLETELIGVLDLSKFFKKNLVQGEISNDRRTLSLRITEETELGDNNSIKEKKKEFPKK
ncbi:hypothetical protein BY996DRAFT_7243426 [Phakopsora pachyrhizi]|nr:hypothetical protein BY996DRAFT_7243426 [Phakopsora pachyrhizi]